MWDGHLGRILVTKHRIQLSKEIDPTNLHPCCARPQKRTLKRDEVDKMLSGNVAEAATNTRVPPIDFAPKTE